MIRIAKSVDAPAIRSVAEAAYHVYAKAIGRPPAPMGADFGRHIERDWVVVDEQDGCIVGYAVVIADGRRALLDNIAVDPSYQGRRIGRSLIDHTEHYIHSLGYETIELYTNVVMTANLAWYQKLGFTETRRVEEHGFHRVYMRKTIKRDVVD